MASSAARIVGLGRGAAQGGLAAIAQPGQRRLEVVRDVVGHRLEPVHQGFDALQHRVEVARQTVELVAAPDDRQPAGQIARHDPLRRPGHGVDPLEHPPGDEEAAGEAEHHHDGDRPAAGRHDDVVEPLALVEIAADQKAEPAGKLEHAGQRLMLVLLRFVEPPVGGLRPAGLVEDARRQRADIAGEPLARRGGDEIEAGARPPRAIVDDEDEAADSALAVLLGKAGDLRVHRLGDLLGDQAAGVPGEIAEQQHGKDGEHREVDQGELERRRADELTECRHGPCIPRRARCGAAAVRTLCRSWNAAGKYARR